MTPRFPRSRSGLPAALADRAHRRQDHPPVERSGVALHRREVSGRDREFGEVQENRTAPGLGEDARRSSVVGVVVGSGGWPTAWRRAREANSPSPRSGCVPLPARVDERPRSAGAHEVYVRLRAAPRSKAEHVWGDLDWTGIRVGPQPGAPEPVITTSPAPTAAATPTSARPDFTGSGRRLRRRHWLACRECRPTRGRTIGALGPSRQSGRPRQGSEDRRMSVTSPAAADGPRLRRQRPALRRGSILGATSQKGTGDRWACRSPGHHSTRGPKGTGVVATTRRAGACPLRARPRPHRAHRQPAHQSFGRIDRRAAHRPAGCLTGAPCPAARDAATSCGSARPIQRPSQDRATVEDPEVESATAVAQESVPREHHAVPMDGDRPRSVTWHVEHLEAVDDIAVTQHHVGGERLDAEEADDELHGAATLGRKRSAGEDRRIELVDGDARSR